MEQTSIYICKPILRKYQTVATITKKDHKRTRSIDNYMKHINIKVDALAFLGSTFTQEDLTDIILDGLNDEYKSITEAVNGRDTPISFPKLSEQFLNCELTLSFLTKSQPQHLPTTSNHAQNRPPTGDPITTLTLEIKTVRMVMVRDTIVLVKVVVNHIEPKVIVWDDDQCFASSLKNLTKSFTLHIRFRNRRESILFSFHVLTTPWCFSHIHDHGFCIQVHPIIAPMIGRTCLFVHLTMVVKRFKSAMAWDSIFPTRVPIRFLVKLVTYI